ncbi:MAG: hypothetical protein FJY82_05950, partial [Candidatus Aminicenantes bacterium]|nr:hypothetical protein [Candidatus Aminicenantes bacterium]
MAEFGRPVASGATVAGLLRSLPDILQARDFRLFVAALRRAKAGRKAVVWALGAHVIKTGLNPVIID